MKREPRIHQLIRHPNIVLLLETLETENCYYMAMELCGGGDLMDRICERKRLEEREVRRYTRQILSAVEHLHRHGIVHSTRKKRKENVERVLSCIADSSYKSLKIMKCHVS
uniref:non-specific serine/threonine protein kinase n=1 Tax=Sinocyclocheilus grahami TaxID=75366 RepID=A0A672MYF4_SINGR